MTCHTSPSQVTNHETFIMSNPTDIGRGFIRNKRIAAEYGLSLSGIHRLEINDPKFPKRRALPGGRMTGFVRSELDEYFTNLPASRSA
jgi:predicted DNA-binding transcriptional regulator AlpA